MRWDALFADMELRLEAADAADRAQQVVDLTRAERAATHLVDRLRGAVGRPVGVAVRGGLVLTGDLTEVGSQWLLLSEQGREHLVPLSATAWVDGADAHVAPPEGRVTSALGLGHALRALARDRVVVRVATSAGTLLGRIEAVGADHLEVSLVRQDTGRPSGVVRVVAFAALDVVSSV